eukprot:295970-Lingulodinium_polyedra.AAC.1
MAFRDVARHFATSVPRRAAFVSPCHVCRGVRRRAAIAPRRHAARPAPAGSARDAPDRALAGL